MREQVRARVHRFRNCVAVYVGTGETVYLTPRDARKLSKAINKAARSIERERFVDSSGNTFELDAPDGRDVVFMRKAPSKFTNPCGEIKLPAEKRATPGHPSMCMCYHCTALRGAS